MAASSDGDAPRIGGGEKTATHRPFDGGAADRLSVLIISDRGVTTRPLPATGSLTLGRSPDSDLVIDDPSISRAHAVLDLGPPMRVRDLGSANGTRVRDVAVGAEPVELASGDVLQLGTATLIIQRRAAPVRTHRLWGHEYFEVRLAEECARGERGDRSFGVARLRCEPRPPVETLQVVLTAEGRSRDVIGEYGPSEYELLLLDLPGARVGPTVAQIAAQLERRGVRVTAGVACFPADGRDADELIHRASPYPRAREASSVEVIGDAALGDRRMQDLYRLAQRIAAGNITVLVLGETGVGKEVLAERVHRSSPRAAGPYVKLNCAALTETLLESELFGHERGAFTGAVQAKAGLLETADGGTVFLDEIGELPLSIQVKLLRVLEDRTVTRVGGVRPRPLDVRFIAATNRDLEADCERGAFRSDLYFRLNGATLVIPPLRERTSEIVSLSHVFAAQAARLMNLEREPVISPDALAVLGAYRWPGNIRELRNVIERAVLLCGDGPIQPVHLPLEKMRGTFEVQATHDERGDLSAATQPSLDEKDAPDDDDEPPSPDERQRIIDALAACAGNQTAAARMLGMGRRTLIKRLERYGISGPRKRRE